MKICFFGWKRAFDYFQIGGTESYVRRLASGLVELGHEVTYAMYGASKRETVLPEDLNATLFYEPGFDDALRQLQGRDFELVVSIYLHPKYRPGFFLFRKRLKSRTHFSTILFSPFRSKTKWILGSMDLNSYDSVFAVSDRISEQIARMGVKSIVLPPPVTDVFFEAAEKRTPDPDGLIRVGYIGRADYGKGFDIAVDIMRSLDKSKYSPSIMTYSWPEKDYEIRPDDFHDWGIKLEKTRYETYSNKIEKNVADFLKVNDIMLFPFRTLDTTIDVPLSVIEAAVAGCKVFIPDHIGLMNAFEQNIPESLVFIEKIEPERFSLEGGPTLLLKSPTNRIHLENLRTGETAGSFLQTLQKGSENVEKS